MNVSVCTLLLSTLQRLVISKSNSLKQAVHRSPRSFTNCSFSSNLRSTRSFWLQYQACTIRSKATQSEHEDFFRYTGSVPGKLLSNVPSEVKRKVSTQFTIGPVVDRDFWIKERSKMDIDRGPCTLPCSLSGYQLTSVH